MPCLIVSFFAMFGCCLLEDGSFLTGNGGGVDLGKKEGCIRELGEVREGETGVGMSCMREKSFKK